MDVINPNMDILELAISAMLATVFTIPSMLLLYHKIIIPKILNGVREQLPPAIIKVVDEKIENFKLYLDDQIESVKMSVLGKLGGSKRTLNTISKFFEKTGINDESTQQAITKWGHAYVEQFLKSSMDPKGSEQNSEPFGRISE